MDDSLAFLLGGLALWALSLAIRSNIKDRQKPPLSLPHYRQKEGKPQLVISQPSYHLPYSCN